MAIVGIGVKYLILVSQVQMVCSVIMEEYLLAPQEDVPVFVSRAIMVPTARKQLIALLVLVNCHAKMEEHQKEK